MVRINNSYQAECVLPGTPVVVVGAAVVVMGAGGTVTAALIWAELAVDPVRAVNKDRWLLQGTYKPDNSSYSVVQLVLL